MTADPTWFAHAACTGLDPDIFFPGQGGDFREAQRICQNCPVRLPCLEYGVTTTVGDAKILVTGIWGGKTERQRIWIRRQRRGKQRSPRPIKHGTLHGFERHHQLGEEACWWCQDANDRHHEGGHYGTDAS